MPVMLRPVTQREHQIVRSLGADGWEVISHGRDLPWRRSDVLIRKNGHMRWVRATQISNSEK